MGGSGWGFEPAGPNGVVETRFEQDAARAAVRGDDVGLRIQ